MNSLVLAFGVAMALVGVVLFATGYPIIEVERGWATVISGATLLAGGVITFALGLLLRAMGNLRKALLENRGTVPAAGPVTPQPVAPAPAEFPVLAASADAPREEVRHPSLDAPHLVPDRPHVEVPLVAESRPEPEPISSPEPTVPQEPEPLAKPPEPAAVSFEANDAGATTAPAAEPDWLDRSFAEFDRENADLATRAPTEPALPLEPFGAAPHREEPLRDDEPVRDEAPYEEPRPADARTPHADAPPLTEASSAVIGRYEADGTSYVMYADGSIEASSPAGVYRFASMAELKSFIEG